MDHDYDIDYYTENDVDNESMVSAFSADRGSTSSVTTADDASMGEASERSASPVPSILSMNSVLRDQLYRQEYGRNLNSYSEVYRLPADEEEIDRLERQYAMLNSLVGGKYTPPMIDILSSDNDPEVKKSVLDLGTGAGNWILDVARDFPHCSAVAVDLTPLKNMYEWARKAEVLDESMRMPPNLRSEVDDINLGLEHFFGDFTIVHARLIAIGVRDYYRMIDQISEVLRPGGLIDLCEVGYVAYDRNHQPIEIDMTKWEQPYWARWLRLVSDAARNRGGDVTASRHLHDWIDGHAAFEEVVHQEFWLPIIPGDWDRPEAEAEFLREHRNVLEYDVLGFLRSGRPLLLGAGYSENFLLNAERCVFMELREGKEPQYSRLERVYGRKKLNRTKLAFDENITYYNNY